MPAHITSDGLTEGVYLLGLATALLLGVRAIGRPSVGAFLQCGLATGVTYLVRPEGAFVGVACGSVAVALAAARKWSRRSTAGWLTALAVGGLLPAAPYMVLIGGITNKPSVNRVWERIINPRQQLMESVGKADAPPAVAGTALFATWLPADSTGVVRVAHVVQSIAKESLKSIHFAPALWAVCGLVVVFHRLRSDPRLWVLVIFVGLNLSVLMLLGYKVGYVSERHTLPLVYVGCLLAAGGLEPAGRWCLNVRALREVVAGLGGPRWAATWVLAALVASALPGALKPLHEHRIGHKHAGEFLAANATAADVIVDPYEWARFYCGRAVQTIPPHPSPFRYRWAVDEPSKGEVSHTVLTADYEDMHKIKADGRSVVAYTWRGERAGGPGRGGRLQTRRAELTGGGFAGGPGPYDSRIPPLPRRTPAMPRDALVADLTAALAAVPLIDPHSHIDPLSPVSRSLADILGYHYYTELAHSAGMPQAAIAAAVPPRERCRAILAHLDRFDNTAQYAWFLDIARTFLGFAGDRVTAADADTLFDAAGEQIRRERLGSESVRDDEPRSDLPHQRVRRPR